MNIDFTINKASKILKRSDIQSANLDAQILLSEIMGVSKEFLILNDHMSLNKEIREKYYKLIRRRMKKEPIAYILGRKEFWSENFLVNSNTLIPRPETELLIYKIVDFFKNKKINILDIGTGSGCILLSILKELKHAKGLGIDISQKATSVAIKNSIKLNLFFRAKFKTSNINFFNSGKYDLIVSNPPYIPQKDIKNLDKDIVNFEPLIALNGGHDGLDLIKKVIYKSSHLLKRNGLLAIEIGTHQYLKVLNLLKKHGLIERDKVYDYNRNVRCIISTKI